MGSLPMAFVMGGVEWLLHAAGGARGEGAAVGAVVGAADVALLEPDG